MSFSTLERNRQIESFRAYISGLRVIHQGCRTKTGRPGRGPRFFAVTECSSCGAIGMTSTGQPQAKRWRCGTCGGVKMPVWADGPTPDEDEIYEQWAKGAKKKKLTSTEQMLRRGHANYVKRYGCSIRRNGDECLWCSE